MTDRFVFLPCLLFLWTAMWGTGWAKGQESPAVPEKFAYVILDHIEIVQASEGGTWFFPTRANDLFLVVLGESYSKGKGISNKVLISEQLDNLPEGQKLSLNMETEANGLYWGLLSEEVRLQVRVYDIDDSIDVDVASVKKEMEKKQAEAAKRWEEQKGKLVQHAAHQYLEPVLRKSLEECLDQLGSVAAELIQGMGKHNDDRLVFETLKLKPNDFSKDGEIPKEFLLKGSEGGASFSIKLYLTLGTFDPHIDSGATLGKFLALGGYRLPDVSAQLASVLGKARMDPKIIAEVVAPFTGCASGRSGYSILKLEEKDIDAISRMLAGLPKAFESFQAASSASKSMAPLDQRRAQMAQCLSHLPFPSFFHYMKDPRPRKK